MVVLWASAMTAQPRRPAPTPPVRPSTIAPTQVTPPTQAAVHIFVGLLLPDLTVRPVPLHALEAVSDRDSTVRVSLRTGVDGTVSQTMPLGRFMIRSIQPVTLNDTSYRWNVPIEVTATGARVDLTNANAVAVAAVRRAAARQVAPEREVFEAVKRGVFRVEAGLSTGSAFLISVPGVEERLVVTNDHVVANSTTASVYLDSVTRVPAVILTRDREADLAILRLPAGRCATCPTLSLAAPSVGNALVVAGERVMAIGFPLNQEMTLTTGIASSIRDGAIISDVNINHGNSGGPMLSLAGEVIGVNTFGDFTTSGGPGISGAIAITRLTPLLAKVSAALASGETPADKVLPVMPLTAYPTSLMMGIVDTVNPKSYRRIFSRTANKFSVNITTPVMYRVSQRIMTEEVGGERKRREAREGVAADEQYSELKEARDWEQYVGNPNAPVVTVAVTPRLAETFGSAFSRALTAGSIYGTPAATMKFTGDVRGARFYRNGVEVEPIRGGHGPQVMRVDNGWVSVKDVADMGYYVLPPEAFEPDSATGAPAHVLIMVQDLKNPNTESSTVIEGAVSARIWNDFGPYFRATRGEAGWKPANPAVKGSSPILECFTQDGLCRLAR